MSRAELLRRELEQLLAVNVAGLVFWDPIGGAGGACDAYVDRVWLGMVRQEGGAWRVHYRPDAETTWRRGTLCDDVPAARTAVEAKLATYQRRTHGS